MCGRVAKPVYTCICHAVTTSQVQAAILSGARTVSEIGERCDAGTGCGGCIKRLESMLDDRDQKNRAVGELPRTA